MARVSMYETLMSLPLFNGVSAEKLSLLLEKIPLEFNKVAKGEPLAHEGDACDMLQFLLTGEAVVRRRLFSGRLLMEQRVGAGYVFMPEHLFGLHTEYNADIIAYTAASVMSISKHRYLEMLEMDRVYQVNLLNYLSYKCQVRSIFLGSNQSQSLVDFCKRMCYGIGDRRAVSTTFQADMEVFSELTGLDKESLQLQVLGLTNVGHASSTTDGNTLRFTLHRMVD